MEEKRNCRNAGRSCRFRSGLLLEFILREDLDKQEWGTQSGYILLGSGFTGIQEQIGSRCIMQVPFAGQCPVRNWCVERAGRDIEEKRTAIRKSRRPDGSRKWSKNLRYFIGEPSIMHGLYKKNLMRSRGTDDALSDREQKW